MSSRQRALLAGAHHPDTPAHLLAGDLIHPAVHGVEQQLGQVGAGTEDLQGGDVRRGSAVGNDRTADITQQPAAPGTCTCIPSLATLNANPLQSMPEHQ